MKKFFKRSALVLCVLVLLLIINYCFAGLHYYSKETEKKLTIEELEDVKEADRLRKTYGDRLFEGFSSAYIPIVAFNSGYEFLINDVPLDSSFEEFESSNGVVNNNIYVRKAVKSQAFAVKLGDKWTASMSTYYTFNSEVLGYMRRDIPLGLWVLVPPQLVTIKRDLLPCTIVHEAVHAYFGSINEQKLMSAEKLHGALKTYPYDDSNFKEAWNKEGAALYNAMNAESREETIRYVKEFIDLRDKRRSEKGLPSDLIDAERLIEWEEGLAKYTEIKMYDFAVEDNASPSYYNYKNGRPYSKGDFKSLKSNLGSRDEDYRFYLSGMAQAMILDKLSDSWKTDLYKDGVYLEDKLREAVKSH